MAVEGYLRGTCPDSSSWDVDLPAPLVTTKRCSEFALAWLRLFPLQVLSLFAGTQPRECWVASSWPTARPMGQKLSILSKPTFIPTAATSFHYSLDGAP